MTSVKMVRSWFVNKGLDDASQAKTEIAAEVKEALQKSMESFGFIIIETLVSVAKGCCPAISMGITSRRALLLEWWYPSPLQHVDVSEAAATCCLWHLQVTDIEPDQKVRAAMNEINAAQRMRMAAKEKAEADRVMVVTRAQGQPHFASLSQSQPGMQCG